MPGPKPHNAPRTPSGQKSRSKAAREWITTQTERAAMEPALSARQRLFGLSEADAREGKAGSVVGRLVLNKVLRQDQYDAAVEYLKVRNAYQRAVGAVPDFTQPPEPGRPPAVDKYGRILTPEEAWQEFSERAKKWHASMMKVVAAVMVAERSPDPSAALDAFLVRDRHDPRLLGALRVSLNALGRHFGIPVTKTQQEAA